MDDHPLQEDTPRKMILNCREVRKSFYIILWQNKRLDAQSKNKKLWLGGKP